MYLVGGTTPGAAPARGEKPYLVLFRRMYLLGEALGDMFDDVSGVVVPAVEAGAVEGQPLFIERCILRRGVVEEGLCLPILEILFCV